MKKKIEKTIKSLDERFGTNDPYTICEILGISVIKEDMPSSTNGFFFSLAGKKAIVINTSIPDDMEKYCLAHELGHAILHEQLNWAFLSQNTYFVTEKYEREADLFAAYLLLGSPIKEKLQNKSLQEIYEKYHIPLAIIEEWANLAA